MSDLLSVYVNENKMLEYDKNTRQPGKQRQHLDKMDLDMDEGIELNGKSISSPNKLQRINYVSLSLIYGIENKNDGMISAACNYLSNRAADLKQIHVIDKGDEVILDYIY